MAKQLTEKELSSKRAWGATIVIALIGAFLFLKPFLSIILLAILLAYLTYPIYKWFLKGGKRKDGTAAALTTLVLMLIIGIPVVAIIAIAINQALSLVDDLGIGEIFANASFESGVIELVEEVNQVIEDFTGVQQAISTDGVINFLQSTLPNLLKALANSMIALASSIPQFFMNLIIFLFVYIGLLTNAKPLLKTIYYLSPFDKDVNDLYFKRIGLMASGMLKGQFLIAFAQGLATAIGLAIVGLGDFFAFFLVFFTFLSLIPLGAGIITIPLGIVMVLTGNVWQGAVLLINHFVIVTNIDNIRPYLVPKEAQMQAALTILAAFAGVAYFGLLGVIYGPIIMIVIVTTIETYVNLQKKQEKALSKA